ncbi:hypothetical protein HY492_01705, partial [Candidatus Woesearchaeota archaeon]|nr:hypothetical protein [Candidatus Woesearchaeota archaeon]
MKMDPRARIGTIGVFVLLMFVLASLSLADTPTENATTTTDEPNTTVDIPADGMIIPVDAPGITPPDITIPDITPIDNASSASTSAFELKDKHGN